MGIDTRVHIVKQHEIDGVMFEIVKALKEGFGDKLESDSVRWNDNNRGKGYDYEFFNMNFILDYENSNFSNNKECRSVVIMHEPKNEMKRDFYDISFGAWGHNKEIAKWLVDYFGGFADYDACDNIKIDYCKSQQESILGINS